MTEPPVTTFRTIKQTPLAPRGAEHAKSLVGVPSVGNENLNAWNRLQKRIAKLSPEEREAYWRERERRQTIGNYTSKRRGAKISLPKLTCLDDKA